MAFADPLVNGSVLVRPAIQSPDYVAGVSGWTINRDGSVEFNGGTFRGDVRIGSASTFLDLSPTVPAELTAFYVATYNATPIGASIRFAGLSNGHPYYAYQVLALRGLTQDRAVMGFGIVDSALTVHEAVAYVGDGSAGVIPAGGVAANFAAVNIGADAGMSLGHRSRTVYNTSTTNGSVDPGKGIVFFDQVTVSTATGAVAGQEYEVYNTSPFGQITFEVGRAYRAEVINGKIKSAAVQNPGCQLRLNTVAGAILLNTPRQPIVATGIDVPFSPSGVFVNNLGFDSGGDLSLTLTPSVATLVNLDAGGNAFGWSFVVTDIGDATGSRFAGAPSV